MNRLYLIILLLSVSLGGFAQNNFTGYPLRKLGSPEDIRMNKIPEFRIENKAVIKNLDDYDHVDNSKNKYFPAYLIDQAGSSCGYASCIGYMYNYEYNYINNMPFTTKMKTLNYGSVFAYMNNGDMTQGTFAYKIFDFMEQNGCATYNYFPDLDADWNNSTKWISDINGYKDMYKYGVESYEKINLYPHGDKYSKDALRRVKQYLLDHGTGAEVGGVVQFSANAHNLLQIPRYSGPSKTGYGHVVDKFSNTGMHSMIIVGFDDTVWWDYNKDGEKTEDEVGAFIMINSWGNRFGTKGKAYIPYKVFTEFKVDEGGFGNGPSREFCIVTPRKKSPKHIIKLKMKHTSRNDLSMKIGASRKENADIPQEEENVTIFDKAGGDLCLLGIKGKDEEVLELGIPVNEDIEDFLQNVDEPTYFLTVKDDKNAERGEGLILSASLINVQTGEEIWGSIDNTVLTPSKTANIRFKTTKLGESSGVVSRVDYVVSNGQLGLYFDSCKKSKVIVEILDLSGNSAKKILNEDLKEGKSEKHSDISDLSAGKYKLKINIANEFMLKTIEIK